jgi:hypothetical protein
MGYKIGDSRIKMISWNRFLGKFVYRDTLLIPPSGGGACVVQRTLPRKKPDAIDRRIHFFRTNSIRLFDSPPDAEGLPRLNSSFVWICGQTSRNSLFYGLFFYDD